MTAFGWAAAVAVAALGSAADSDPGTALERLLAAISRNTAITAASADFDAPIWKEREAKLRSVRAAISPAIGVWDRGGAQFVPEWTGEYKGLTWAGHAVVNGAAGGGGAVETGLLLLNTERKKVAFTGRLGELSHDKAKLLRSAVVLEALKSALILRVHLGRLEQEDTARRSFDRFLDTLLLKLRPFVDGGLIPANSLNNILGLKESNLEETFFLSNESALLKKRARESFSLDSADFLPLDIGGIVSILEGRNRWLQGGRPSYAHRLDSLEYEIARAQLEMERIQDNQLFIGLGMEGWRRPDGPMEKGYRLRLGWNASFGPAAKPGRRSVPALPLRTVEPEQPDVEDEMEKISRHVRKQLNDALAGRLSEIRLGQVASVFAISENLGRLLDNSLRPILHRQSRRLHAVMRIESLEELGLRVPETMGRG